jgi:catechol 2,3-dioxygenase-like lactoylglutathione lyase family enzyme
VPDLTGILETALYVEDPRRSADFYTRVLGFERIDGDERLVAMAVRPGQLLLLCAKGGSVELPRTAHFGDGHHHLAFAVPEDALAAWIAKLEAVGVAVVERRRWPRGGESLYFRDPDQHLLELATPGVWSVY